jgi:hypothetical protein
LLFPYEKGFSGLGLGLIVGVGFAASDPVVTSFSLAGFAGGRRPHAPGGRTPIPGRFQVSSGRLPTHPGLLLDAPQWPSESSQGNHLLFFRFAQHVAHIDEGYMPHAKINVPGLILVGRFSTDPHWPVLGDP